MAGAQPDADDTPDSKPIALLDGLWFGDPGHASHQNGLDADVYFLQRGASAKHPVARCTDGTRFEAPIPEFTLSVPRVLH